MTKNKKILYAAPSIMDLEAEFSGIICVSGGASVTDPTLSISNVRNGQRYYNNGSQTWN